MLRLSGKKENWLPKTKISTREKGKGDARGYPNRIEMKKGRDNGLDTVRKEGSQLKQ